MGTAFVFTVWTGADREAAAAEAIQGATRLVHELEGRISEWRPDSEVTAVNHAAGVKAISVSDDTLELFEASIEWSRRTGGAFDVTAGQLFELWKKHRKEESAPTAAEIAARVKSTGYAKIRIEGNEIFLTEPDTRVGFGAIGKGFAADRVAEYLKARGFNDFIVDAGGDLVIGGSRGEQPWDIAIRHPRAEQILGTLRAGDCSVATSGDYENYFEVDGVRYSHIVDPRNGAPTRGVISATIVTRRGADADALATAVFVLGVAAGLALVNELPDTDALLVDEKGKLHLSDGLRVVDGEIQWLH